MKTILLITVLLYTSLFGIGQICVDSIPKDNKTNIAFSKIFYGYLESYQNYLTEKGIKNDAKSKSS